MLSNAKHLGNTRARFFTAFRTTDEVILNEVKDLISLKTVWSTRFFANAQNDAERSFW